MKLLGIQLAYAAMTLTPMQLSDAPAYRVYAARAAGAVGLNVDLFLATIDCENPSWNPEKQSEAITKNGTRENSWGLPQINLGPRAHPEVTKAQATDPFWSIDWMVKEWSAGRQWQWTCYKKVVAARAATVSLATAEAI